MSIRQVNGFGCLACGHGRPTPGGSRSGGWQHKLSRQPRVWKDLSGPRVTEGRMYRLRERGLAGAWL